MGSAGACGSAGGWSAGGALAALAVPCRTTFGNGVARVRRNGWRGKLHWQVKSVFNLLVRFLFYGVVVVFCGRRRSTSR